jgi:hypothetical protein
MIGPNTSVNTPISLRIALAIRALLTMALAVLFFWGLVRIVGSFAPDQPINKPAPLSKALVGWPDICGYGATPVSAIETSSDYAATNYLITCLEPDGSKATISNSVNNG